MTVPPQTAPGTPVPVPALIVGGGPAGLMAAEALCNAGLSCLLAEAKPSLGRKFLMAGKSGLNLSRMEDPDRFLSRYDSDRLAPMIRAFPPEAVRHWTETLGQDTFTGSTGRLFPTAMKASPLLRAWLARLTAAGLQTRTRWRWTGWHQDGAASFATPEGPRAVTAAITILALGGGSWARLGSDGAWQDIFQRHGLPTQPFLASNIGLSVPWSDHMKPHLGQPLKGLAWRAGDSLSRGEAVLSARGLEGGGLYPLAPALRQGAPLTLDLCPDIDLARLAARLARPRGKQSLSSHLRRVLRLAPQTQALLMEWGRPLPDDPQALAHHLKALPVRHTGLRPLDEAISTVGGLPWQALDRGLMLRDRPGIFCAGEMIDWDAPTGGYLLTACLATGLWAGQHAARWQASGR